MQYKIFSTDTIYALASGKGKAGVAVIRVSGPHTEHLIAKLGVKIKIKPRYAHYTQIFHPEDGLKLDDVILLFFKSPNSFTGEDVLEIHCHGGIAVINSILEALSKISAEVRMAEAGEFSKRAFNNGKMDLTQVEGLADLIDSSTRAQANLALKQISGSLRQLYEDWRKDLLKIMSLIEAYIDFPDEEIPEDVVIHAEEKINHLMGQMQRHLDDKHRGEKIREGVKVAIIGAPNVGKSSIMNLMAKRNVAIVSDVAGTTRDVIEVHLDISGVSFHITDTAGIRENTVDKIEIEGIRRTIITAQEADLKLIVIDVTNFQESIKHVSEFIDGDYIIILNKQDAAEKYDDSIFDLQNTILFSAVTKEGEDQLIKKISEYGERLLNSSNLEAPMITRARHRENIQGAYKSLEIFSLSKPLELASEDLRKAAFHLGQITGFIGVEEVLGEIFSSFCIGK
jgi:tRNA modification GTPase